MLVHVMGLLVAMIDPPISVQKAALMVVSGTFYATAHLEMGEEAQVLRPLSSPIMAFVFGRTVGKVSRLGTESPGTSV